jgi:hypothetical protein
MNQLNEMSSNHRYIGWACTVDGVPTGTCNVRHGPFSFDYLAKQYPSSHVVEHLVFAPLLNEGSDGAYFNLCKSIKVQVREYREVA